MDDDMGFLQDKLQNGISSTAPADIQGALSRTFSVAPPTLNPQGQNTPQLQGTGTNIQVSPSLQGGAQNTPNNLQNNTQNKALTLQMTNPQQQTDQSQPLKLNFGQPNQDNQQSPQLNTQLVNYNKPVANLQQTTPTNVPVPTYKPFNIAGATPVAKPNALTQIAGGLENAGKGLYHSTAKMLQLPEGEVQQGAAAFTGNKQAFNNAANKAHQGATAIRQYAQSVPTGLLGIPKSVEQIPGASRVGNDIEHLPVVGPTIKGNINLVKDAINSKIGQGIEHFNLGSKPNIQSFQQVYKNTPGGAPAKGTAVALQGAGDVLNVLGVHGLLKSLEGVPKGGVEPSELTPNNLTNPDIPAKPAINVRTPFPTITKAITALSGSNKGEAPTPAPKITDPDIKAANDQITKIAQDNKTTPTEIKTPEQTPVESTGLPKQTADEARIAEEFTPEAMVRSGLADNPEQAKTLIAQNEATNDFFPSDAEFNALTSEGGLPSDTDALQREQDLEEQLGPKAWKQLSPDIKKQMLGTGGPEKARQLTPEEAVVRVARGVKGRPGTYDETVKAFMNKGLEDRDGNLFQYNGYGGPRSIPYDQIPAEVSKILEENDVTPIGGRHGEYTAGQPQVATNPFPVNKEEDVIQPMKPEKGIVKIESLGTRLSKMGAPGRELLKRIDNARAEESIIDTRLNDATPTLDKLSKDQVNELFALHKSKGELQTDDPMVQQASDELRSIMPKAQQDALQAGLSVGDRGEWYLPQSFKPGFFDKANNFDAAVKHLVKSGQAADENQAIELLNLYKTGDYMGGKVFSNLERQRNFDIPGYRTDVGSIKSYFRNYSRRIAQTHQFGVNNEEVTDLINRANRSGQDAQAMQNVFNKYWNPDRGTSGAFGKTANVALETQRILQLQKAFISHTPQGFVNIGSKVGFIPYMKALARQAFSSTDRAYAHDAGVDNEDLHDTVSSGRIKNPAMEALQAVRHFHRTTAFIGAEHDILKMAAKGDEGGLRNEYGIQGDLPKDSSGRISLTNEQMFQASHHLSDSTIFTTDPIQSSALVQGNAGKFLGQYRGQYVFKQAAFINNLVKDAVHGNPAPLIRYLAVGVPVAGVTVTALKQLFEGKNPIAQVKKNPKSELEQAAYNSGVETVGSGTGEDVANEVEYHTPNESWQNIANTATPSAGNVVETGQNVDNAVRGNKNALIKQVSGYVPGGSALLNSRVGKSVGYNPPKIITPAQQAFDNAWDTNYNKAIKSLSPSFSKSDNSTAVKQDEKTRDIFQSLVQSNHTSAGATILKTTDQTMAQAQNAVAYPKALQAYQRLEQSLPGHNPVYNLPFNKLQAYEAYEALGPGTPQKTVMEQKDPWLINTFNQEQTWFNNQQSLSNTVTPKGYVPYPTISPQQSAMMTQVTQLASNQNRTPAQETQLENLENNQSLQAAYTLLDNYTNARRASIPGGELSPIPYPTQNMTPAQESLLQQEEALPANTGQKSALIKANQNQWNALTQIMADDTQYNIEKYGGVVQQGGTEPELLKDESNIGQDIAVGTNTTTGQKEYQLNPALAYSGGTQGGFTFAQGSGSGGSGSSSSSNPLVPLPKVKRGKLPKMRKPPKLHGFRAPHVKKAQRVRVQANGNLHAVQVAKPTSVVKLAS